MFYNKHIDGIYKTDKDHSMVIYFQFNKLQLTFVHTE